MSRRPPNLAPPSCASRADFFAVLAQLQPARVLELGTRGWDGKPPKHNRERVKEACPQAQWIGVDVQDGDGVDVVCDAHYLSRRFPPCHFDAFVACSTFEHLRRPWLVAQELAAIVRVGGIGFVETHQSFPLHGYPHDYFRFSREALAELFAPDVGWWLLGSWYQYRCQVVPDDVIPDWNKEAFGFLNVAAVVRRGT